MQNELENYKVEMQQELESILTYWVNHAVDLRNGGFAGKIDNDNKVDERAPKGSVLNSGILWTFSSAYNLTHVARYLQMAERAYKYINNYFIDKKLGGIYWTVDYRGNPLDTKKQVYALAFAVYGLSEYYVACKDEPVKQLAIDLYKAIVEHSYDKNYGGYIEAFTKEWKEIDDLQLSDKKENERKSMNTHLHVLQAYANLYRIWPDESLKHRIVELINIFLDRIIHPATNHLQLFFGEQWNPKGNILSFGHDIEAAWLIQEAAEVIQDEVLFQKVKNFSLKIANAATRGLDADGGLWLKYDADEKQLVKEKSWWPQAEAMIGYFNAWQLTHDIDYLRKSLASWSFVKSHILNKEKGEWYSGVTDTYSVVSNEDKVSLLKGPYHNSRACIEIIKRISSQGNITTISDHN